MGELAFVLTEAREDAAFDHGNVTAMATDIVAAFLRDAADAVEASVEHISSLARGDGGERCAAAGHEGFGDGGSPG
ncbi:MAG: hypothetical protein AAF968_24840, partial [Pseudomonadota bacterium]